MPAVRKIRTRHARLRRLGAALLVSGLAGIGAPTADARARSAQSPPAQGAYENCALATHEAECLERLGELRGAGITVVLNYWTWQGTAVQIAGYAARADELGMQLIWPPVPDAGSLTHRLLAPVARERRLSVAEYAIGLVRDLPATWGYYVGEEAWTSEEVEVVKRYSRLVHELDPGHPRLYVGWGMGRFRPGLRPLLDDVDVIGADYYPVGTSAGTVGGTKRFARRLAALARAHGLASATVLQAFSWASEPTLAPPGPHRWPTVAEMRRMRNLSYRGARSQTLMLWFDYYFIKPPGTSSRAHLNDLATALAAPYPVLWQRVTRGA